MRVALAMLMVLLLAGCSGAASTMAESPAPSATTLHSPAPATTASPSASPLPSGGISEERAIALAGQHVGPNVTFAAATAGTYGALTLDPNAHPANPLPSHVVWAVRYTGEFVICPPLAAPSAGAPFSPQPCWSPRPGTTVVFLDYLTGQWLTTESYSPEP